MNQARQDVTSWSSSQHHSLDLRVYFSKMRWVRSGDKAQLVAENQKGGKKERITCRKVTLLVDQPYVNQEVIVDTKGDCTSGNCMVTVIWCQPMMSFYLTCIIEYERQKEIERSGS